MEKKYEIPSLILRRGVAADLRLGKRDFWKMLITREEPYVRASCPRIRGIRGSGIIAKHTHG